MSPVGPAADSTWVAAAAAGAEEAVGPLAVAACLVEPRSAAALAALELERPRPEAKLRALGRQVRSVVPTEVVRIGAERRSQLVAKLGKLEKVLVWAHAKALAELLSRYPAARRVACAAFGPELRTERALARIPGELEVVRVEPGTAAPPGGAGPGLLAAGILARAAVQEAREKPVGKK